MLVRILAMAVLCLCCSIGHAEEKAVEIPLSEIWAHSMPETKKISNLANNTKNLDLLMEGIGKQNSAGGWERKADEAFIAEGAGLHALKIAHSVITKRIPRPTSVQYGNEISVVFYTLYTGCYVHLKQVELEGDEINIKYEMIPHKTKELTQHFAIIPLGKLSKGKFKVNISAKPISQRFLDMGLPQTLYDRTEQRVSSSFAFSVE